MAEITYTDAAQEDLDGIAEYTLATWGVAQTDRYLHDLLSACFLLANNPSLGRADVQGKPSLRRHPHGSHVLYYRSIPGGIRISRILHQRMSSPLHLADGS